MNREDKRCSCSSSWGRSRKLAKIPTPNRLYQPTRSRLVTVSDQRPVVRSLVSANRWLRGIKIYRFPWYLTLVSAHHASSNPGQVFDKVGKSFPNYKPGTSWCTKYKVKTDKKFKEHGKCTPWKRKTCNKQKVEQFITGILRRISLRSRCTS